MALCTECGTEVEPGSKRGRRCADCHAEYMREWHYQRNAEVRDLLIAEKARRRCEWEGGCQFNVTRPIHLGFDHLPGHEKSFELGKAQMLGKTVEEVQTELAKCQVLCHNHHAEMTALRGKLSVALRAEIEMQVRNEETEHA